MKSAKFDYQAPASLADACEALATHGDAGKALGGSQSLGPMLNMRLTRPAFVVDVARLAELRTVTLDGGRIRIGAAVTHADIEDGVHAPLRGSLMQSVARGIAYRAIRNRGTLGGSLAHADPAADWVVVCMALGAQLELVSAGGRRTMPIHEFVLGAYTTALSKGEIIVAVLVPGETATTRWAYEKSCRKTGEFAQASCAAWFDPARRVGRIVLGALDGAPRILPRLTTAFAAAGGAAWRTSAFDELMAAEVAEAAPDRDRVDHSLMVAVLRRCLERLTSDRGADAEQVRTRALIAEHRA